MTPSQPLAFPSANFLSDNLYIRYSLLPPSFTSQTSRKDEYSTISDHFAAAAAAATSLLGVGMLNYQACLEGLPLPPAMGQSKGL